jgi:hypothetical protein
VIRDSFAVQSYAPRDTAAWDEADERYRALAPV